jgi:6-phosphogluconolactonase
MSSGEKQKANLKVFADADAVARQCLRFFIDLANHAIKTNGVFCVAISGGHTPIRFFELLGSDAGAQNLTWEKIHIFWVDERYVPNDSPYSNYKLAADTFLNKISIPKQNVHPIPTGDDDSASAAKKYEENIREVFNIKSDEMPVFDLIILGMGADGHTGSLFPGCYASYDTDDLACVVYLLDQELPDELITRITLTHPVLCAASRIVLLVTGSAKAQILKEVLTGPPDDIRYPVHMLWHALDKITWLVDSEAGKLL